MATTYGGYTPPLENLKIGDTLLFGDNLSLQSSEIQELLKQGAIETYADPSTGAHSGMRVTKSYTKPGNISSSQVYSGNISPQFYQIREEGMAEQPTVYQMKDGQMTSITNASAGISAGLQKTIDRQPDQQYWSNVKMVTPQEFQTLSTPVSVKDPSVELDETYRDKEESELDLWAKSQKESAQDLLDTQTEALEAEFQYQKSEIESKAKQSIQETKDFGGRIEGSLRRVLGKAGGFTTTAGGMAMVTQANTLQSEINEIKRAEAMLISKARVAQKAGESKQAELYYERITDLESDIRDRQQEIFDNILKLDKEKREWDKLDFDMNLAILGEERSQTELALKLRAEMTDFTDAQIDKTLGDIERLASSLTPLSNLSGELITEYEILAGLPEGSFEAFYDKLYREAERGEKIDILKVQKEQLAIQNLVADLTKKAADLVGTKDGDPYGSASQFVTANYASRIVDANKTLKELEALNIGVLDYASGSKFWPNIAKSSDRQRFEQATKNYINAVLRRESGAAIAASEFKNAGEQYIPQPGDREDVLAQKEINRKLVQRNFINEAGTAYVSPPGEEEESETNPEDPLSIF